VLKEISANTLVTYVELLYQNIVDRCTEICMSIDDVDEITELLKILAIKNNVKNRHEHIKQIENNVIERKAKNQLMICPLCGKALVERKGPYGQFLGCSGFPKCKYTRNN